MAHEEVGTLSESLPFGLAIIDEAQHPAAWSFSDDPRLRRSFVRLKRLTTETPRLLLLSATPILHNEREFLAMLHLLSPEMYGLDDVEKLRMSVKTRQEIGRVLVGLQPDRPVFLLRAQIQKLRELLPNDELLGGRLNELSHLLENETGVSQSSGAVREVRAHISEAYRLHRRMLRNRRAMVGKGLLLPRWQDGGAASVIEDGTLTNAQNWPRNAAKLDLYTVQIRGWRGLTRLESAGHFEVRRVQIPSGTPNLFKSLRGAATFGAGTKRHNSVANFWPGLPNRQCFRASCAVLVGTKRHMQIQSDQAAATAGARKRRMTLL